MGATSERVLVFTKVSTGRSPMIAIRVAPIKPAAVVFHGGRRIDPLAITLADKESIPLILSLSGNIEELVNGLRGLKQKISF
ncbi:MAG: transcriptional regulator, partial [Sulfolobales archaeon]